jgi:hypothetical protein
MTSAAPCLSLALQLPAASEPLVVDPDSLLALHHALQSFGEFQQPYSAPVDVTDPDAGTIDATVEISAGYLQDGPQVIILDADVDQAPERYLVLNEPWQSLSAGTLLLVCGDDAVFISTQDLSQELARAEIMLTFLDLLPEASEARAHPESCSAVTDSDISGRIVKSILNQLCASTPGLPVTDTTLTLWNGRLPDALLALWQRDGLARYQDDRLTMVDPVQYEAVLAAFLAGSPLWGKDDFHVYAISPFGQMLICGERTGVELTLEPHEGHLCVPAAATLPTSSIARNRRLHDFLLTLDDPELDVLTEDEEPMFWRVREMLGPLGDGEIYTSTESVSEHGWRLGGLVKRKALDVLAELAPRR